MCTCKHCEKRGLARSKSGAMFIKNQNLIKQRLVVLKWYHCIVHSTFFNFLFLFFNYINKHDLTIAKYEPHKSLASYHCSHYCSKPSSFCCCSILFTLNLYAMIKIFAVTQLSCIIYIFASLRLHKQLKHLNTHCVDWFILQQYLYNYLYSLFPKGCQ